MFSVRWEEVYFNIFFEGEFAVRSFFSAQPAFKLSKNKYSKQIEDYFSGRIYSFSIPFRIKGSDFMVEVLEETLKIPYGEVRTYSDIAKKLETSPRAVGQALKRNPLPVIIPCHRVVAKNGMGGYTVGGITGDNSLRGRGYGNHVMSPIKIKERLLRLEGAIRDPGLH